MKRASSIFVVLATANLLLASALVLGLHRQARVSAEAASLEPAAIARATNEATPLGLAIAEPRSKPDKGSISNAPPTSFTMVYSSDPKEFVASLRRIHCPEETIKDILTAEVHRRFQEQEKELRPKPQDHVPFSWSARTSEPRLLERREKAAALAREESTLLRGALSCELTVPMPLYAMTLSDQQFEAVMASSINACAIRDVQDNYWAEVQALQQRTKGFWLPEDVAQLEQIKARRREVLIALEPPQ